MSTRSGTAHTLQAQQEGRDLLGSSLGRETQELGLLSAQNGHHLKTGIPAGQSLTGGTAAT